MKKIKMLSIIIIVLALVGTSLLLLSEYENSKKRIEVNPDSESTIVIDEDTIVIRPKDIGSINLSDIINVMNQRMQVERDGIIQNNNVIPVSYDDDTNYRVLIGDKAYDIVFNFEDIVFIYDSGVYITAYNRKSMEIKNYPHPLYLEETYQTLADLDDITTEVLYARPHQDTQVFDIVYVMEYDVVHIDSVNKDDRLTSMYQVPEKIGYKALGWYDEEGSLFDEATTITRNYTLFAHYEVLSYVVSVYEINQQNEKVLVKEETHNYGSQLYLNFFDKDDWNIYGGIYYQYDETSQNYHNPVNINQNILVTEDITLYVKYTYFPHIQYYDGEQLILREYYDSGAVVIPQVSKDGYRIIGWYLEKELINEFQFGTTPPDDMKLYAKWDITVYEITYDLDDGTNHPDNPSQYNVQSGTINLLNPTKEGYDFVGWFNEEDIQVTTIDSSLIRNIHLTARFTIQSYNIVVSDGSGNETVYEDINYGELLPKPSNPVKEGYNFVEWVDENGNPFDFDVNTARAGLMISPMFSLITYTISYDTGGGTNDESNPTSYDIETPNITLASPNRLGYTFEGWFNLNDEQVTTITQGSFGDITLKAEWAIILYSITYELDGGLNDDRNPANYTIASETITLYAPTKEGYNFMGWYEGEVQITTIVQGSTGDIELKATFEIRVYEVSFVDYNGNILSTQMIEHGSDASLPDNPTREGFRFTGWQGDYQNVTESRSIVAIYIQQYQVSIHSEGTAVTQLYFDMNNSLTQETRADIETLLLNENFIPENHQISHFEKDGVYVNFTETYNANVVLEVVYQIITATPTIVTGMSRVYWQDNEMISESDETFVEDLWYNYSKSEWANVMTADGSYWVWIPRFSYVMIQRTTTGNTAGTIYIRFSTSDGDGGFIDDTADNYVVHQAFTHGGSVAGFWMAKFETSRQNASSSIRVIPGVTSLRNITLNNMVVAADSYAKEAVWESVAVDVTMINQYHWDATSFLAHSAYGLNGVQIVSNNDASYMTGGGNTETSYISNVTQSATGNVSGVYDMSGGAWEYVISFVDLGQSYTLPQEIEATSFGKYLTYHLSASTGSVPPANETASIYNGWFGASMNWPASSTGVQRTWILRGGQQGNETGGLFILGSNNNNAAANHSFRLALVPSTNA